jgi:hypothetical protein
VPGAEFWTQLSRISYVNTIVVMQKGTTWCFSTSWRGERVLNALGAPASRVTCWW